MGGKSKSSSKDPLGPSRQAASDLFMKQYEGWKSSGGPTVPTWMQGPASTMGPLTSTLNESINTGLPTNVSGLAEASRTKAMRDLNQDILPQLLEKFSVGGTRFGTGATDAISRTIGDLLANLAVNENQLGFQASESAAGRRMSGMGMAGLPVELQKQAMMVPELLQFILGAMPTQKASSWQVTPPDIKVGV